MVRYTNGKNVYKQVTEKRKARRDFFSGTVSLFDFPHGGLAAGDHVFPFSFTLASDLPSSFFYKNAHTKRAPKA